jgi:peptidoglycan hydrolase-like protein with peptidoglycan-binding domain
MSGADVKALQTLLMTQGYPIPAGATGYFASQTKTALSAYQSAHGIIPAQGYFGIKTRTQMKVAGLGGLWW